MTLEEFLARSPNCRIEIRSSQARRRPEEGDVRFLRDGTAQVRKQGFWHGCYMVRRWRPVLEWTAATDDDIELATKARRIVSDKRPKPVST